MLPCFSLSPCCHGKGRGTQTCYSDAKLPLICVCGKVSCLMHGQLPPSMSMVEQFACLIWCCALSSLLLWQILFFVPKDVEIVPHRGDAACSVMIRRMACGFFFSEFACLIGEGGRSGEFQCSFCRLLL